MEENRMKKHVTAVAILQIVFGAFSIIGAIVLIFAFGIAKHFADDQTASFVLNIISVPLTIGLVLLGTLDIIGAVGLFYSKNWARIMTLIMGGLGLLNIPIGTLKGVYVIWTLVQTETVALFEGKKPDVLQQ
jgi:hypothetical protein